MRLVLRDLRVVNRGLLVIQFILPIFLLFVASYPLTALISPFQIGGELVTYQRFIAMGLIAQTTMTGSLVGGTLLFTDRRHGMFEQILVGPFGKSGYAIAKMVSSMIIGLVGSVLVALFGLPFTYGIHVSVYGAGVALLSILAGALLFSGMSITLASLFRSLEAFEGTFNLLLILFTFASSVLYPLTAVPGTLRALMLLNPLTYDADLLRMGLLGLQTPYAPWEALVLVLESVGIFGLALRSFSRIQVRSI